MNSTCCRTLADATSLLPLAPIRICMASLVIAEAMRCTATGHVAVNMSVWRLAVEGITSTMERIWGSNPMSNMRSASSNTKYSTFSPDTAGCRKSDGRRKSTRRPGVATTMSAPCRMARSWSLLHAPPYSTSALALTLPATLSASAPICCANSRVGANTRNRGLMASVHHPVGLLSLFGGGLGPDAKTRARAGRMKPQVLPLPVFATATRSRPAITTGHAAA
mmetsp:Transcript_72476/g.170447  ORF Transcript_72476/g.170447 Transcript_72476/m.170447 type:complete len:222 (-) Transcript_72476:600-1265(-)